jgi:hypothetical protein
MCVCMMAGGAWARAHLCWREQAELSTAQRRAQEQERRVRGLADVAQQERERRTKVEAARRREAAEAAETRQRLVR